MPTHAMAIKMTMYVGIRILVLGMAANKNITQYPILANIGQYPMRILF